MAARWRNTGSVALARKTIPWKNTLSKECSCSKLHHSVFYIVLVPKHGITSWGMQKKASPINCSKCQSDCWKISGQETAWWGTAVHALTLQSMHNSTNNRTKAKYTSLERAIQSLSGSGLMGAELCVHNRIVTQTQHTLPALVETLCQLLPWRSQRHACKGSNAPSWNNASGNVGCRSDALPDPGYCGGLNNLMYLPHKRWIVVGMGKLLGL